MCSLNETQYQCKCEGLFVWPNDTCHSYDACDVITDGSCTCINALPTGGQFCQGETTDIFLRQHQFSTVNYFDRLIMCVLVFCLQITLYKAQGLLYEVLLKC